MKQIISVRLLLEIFRAYAGHFRGQLYGKEEMFPKVNLFHQAILSNKAKKASMNCSFFNLFNRQCYY